METVQVLRLTAIRAVVVLYNPKDQQGCQRRYTTSETLAMMARKCQRMRRIRMRSKDGSSCARLQAGTLASTSSTVVVVLYKVDSLRTVLRIAWGIYTTRTWSVCRFKPYY